MEGIEELDRDLRFFFEKIEKAIDLGPAAAENQPIQRLIRMVGMIEIDSFLDFQHPLGAYRGKDILYLFLFLFGR